MEKDYRFAGSDESTQPVQWHAGTSENGKPEGAFAEARALSGLLTR
jgi:hypothetical protein